MALVALASAALFSGAVAASRESGPRQIHNSPTPTRRPLNGFGRRETCPFQPRLSQVGLSSRPRPRLARRPGQTLSSPSIIRLRRTRQLTCELAGQLTFLPSWMLVGHKSATLKPMMNREQRIEYEILDCAFNADRVSGYVTDTELSRSSCAASSLTSGRRSSLPPANGSLKRIA